MSLCSRNSLQRSFGSGEGLHGSAQRQRHPLGRTRNEAVGDAEAIQNATDSSSHGLSNAGVTTAVDVDTCGMASPANFVSELPVDLWDQAYRRFCGEKKDLMKRYERIVTKVADVDDHLPLHEKARVFISKKLQTMNNRQWKLRIPWKHEPVFVRSLVGKIVRITQKLQVAGSIIANIDPIHVGLPFAGICILVQLITNDSQQHSALLHGIDKATDLISLYAAMEEGYRSFDQSNIKNAFAKKVEDLYFHVLDFLFNAVCYLGLSTAQRIVRNVPKLDDFDSALEIIGEIEQNCQRVAASLAFVDQRNGMKTLVDILEQQQLYIEEFVHNLGVRLDENKRIIQWASAIDVESDHNLVRQKLGINYAESGEWLRPKYLDWIKCSAKQTFWLCGSAGMGKSSLVSSVVEWHLKSISSSDRDRLAYFYCSRKRSDCSQPNDVLASFVAQLSWSVDGLSVAESTKALYQSNPKRQMSLKDCSDLLIALILPYNCVTLVIDALDECLNSSQLLRHLRNVSNNTNGTVKFFLSSRRNTVIFTEFPSWTKMDLDLQRELTEPDMERYIRCQVRDIKTLDIGTRLLQGKYPEIEDRIIKTLTRRAQGMFRWAELQLASFLGPNSSIHHPKDATSKLEKLERETGMPELDSTYEEIYQMNTAAQSESRNISVRAYKWILACQRPLLISELVQAVPYDLFGVPDPAVTPELILRLCSNFLFVDSCDVVRFSHLSAREYLEKRRSDSILDYSSSQVHTQAAVSCLAFLNFTDITDEINDSTERAEFIRYTISFWMAHLQRSREGERSSLLESMFRAFLGNLSMNVKTPFSKWISALEKDVVILVSGQERHQKIRACISRPPNLLFLACVWGFHEILEIVAGDFDLQQCNIDGMVALWTATKYGNYDLVIWLLDHGADINANPGSRGSAIHAAASCGYENIVKILLEHGASLNILDKRGTSALGAAAANGHESIFRLLFDHSTDNSNYGNALRFAASAGNYRLIEILLGRRVDVNSPDSYNRTPLVLAACYGHKVAVEILLEHGANANALSERWGGALHLAAQGGHIKVVKVLIDRGADINLQLITADECSIDTPLHDAVRKMQKRSVLFLIRRGADINALGGFSEARTPLQMAIRTGQTSMVRYFLRRGATAYPRASEYNFELYIASELGNAQVVKTMLELGADVNFLSGYYGTPLQACAQSSRSGIETVAKLLLVHGAQVNLIDQERPYLPTPLEAAAFGGNISLVRLFLENGACVNANQSDFGSALVAAAAGGYVPIVQVLLDNGADTNICSKRYGPAIHAAACQADNDVIQLLLSNGANVNIEGGQHFTALQAAAALVDHGALEMLSVIEILLNHGAEVNKLGGEFGSALQAAAYHFPTKSMNGLSRPRVDVDASGGLDGITPPAATCVDIAHNCHDFDSIDFPNLSTIEILLKFGANVNVTEGLNGSALQASALVGNEGAVKLLLNYGADVNLESDLYGTALAAAARLGPPKENYGCSDRAPLTWYRNIVQILLDHDAIVDERVMEAAKTGGDAEIILLLSKKLREVTKTEDSVVVSPIARSST